ncbi:MAG: DsbA family protein [Pseudonocardiaceae bacterium]
MTEPLLDPPLGVHDYVLGTLGSARTLVEYGDFQCPYCRRAVPVIHEVRERMGDQLAFGFRHFPLADVHPFALAAAVAAEAAGLVGQFWPMHGLLFAGEPRLRQDDLRGYASQLGIEPASVVWPATQLVEDRVEADFNSGVRSGVRGTPTLFVDGRAYRGEVTVKGLLAEFSRAPGALSGSA